MEDVMAILSRAHAVKKLRKKAEDCENGNYHSECAFLSELADKLDQQEPPDLEEIVKWIIKRNWMC